MQRHVELFCLCCVDAVLELFDELLKRSRVFAHKVDGMPRHGILEPVRHYGLQRLERSRGRPWGRQAPEPVGRCGGGVRGRQGWRLP